MKTQRIEFIIARFQPGRIDPPRPQSFVVEMDATMTVLDGLERIRLTQDPTLIYRHSCHHSSCGTCACRINGAERLACTTRPVELGGGRITVEPLEGFERLADLAVDMRSFYRDIDPHWSGLKPCGPGPGSVSSPGPVEALLRFEECIECGACVSACPAVHDHRRFMGPAALAALHNEMKKSPDARKRLLTTAGGERGERWCRRALACSRVCPTGVYPARHIADLRRLLAKKEPDAGGGRSGR